LSSRPQPEDELDRTLNRKITNLITFELIYLLLLLWIKATKQLETAINILDRVNLIFLLK